MKTFSVKNLKKTTRRICAFTDKAQGFTDTTTTATSGDPTTTTITVVTTTGLR